MEAVLIQVLPILLVAGAYFVLFYLLFRLLNPSAKKSEKQEQNDGHADNKEYTKKSIVVTLRNTLIWLLIVGLLIVCFKSCSFGRNSGGGGNTSIADCVICGKDATHKFQGSSYCGKHYDDAVKWAIDHVD